MKSISINDLVQPKETLTQEKMTSISGGWSTIFDVFDLINARLEEARLKRKIDAYMASRRRGKLRAARFRRARRYQER